MEPFSKTLSDSVQTTPNQSSVLIYGDKITQSNARPRTQMLNHQAHGKEKIVFETNPSEKHLRYKSSKVSNDDDYRAQEEFSSKQ